MAFITVCPKCGHDRLLLISFSATCAGVLISEDGFNVNDANQMDTSDEVVHCGSCDYQGPLASDDDDKQGEPVNRIAYSVDEDSIRYRWDDVMEGRNDDDQVILNWNNLESEIQDMMLDRIGDAISNSGATEAVDEAIFQVATSYMEAIEADSPPSTDHTISGKVVVVGGSAFRIVLEACPLMANGERELRDDDGHAVDNFGEVGAPEQEQLDAINLGLGTSFTFDDFPGATKNT